MNNEQLLDFCVWLQANFDAIMKMDWPAPPKSKEKLASAPAEWGEPVSDAYWQAAKRRWL